MIQPLGNPTMATLLAAGLIFLLALVLGIWKYRQIVVVVPGRRGITVHQGFRN